MKIVNVPMYQPRGLKKTLAEVKSLPLSNNPMRCHRPGLQVPDIYVASPTQHGFLTRVSNKSLQIHCSALMGPRILTCIILILCWPCPLTSDHSQSRHVQNRVALSP
jgi:hypothetical protein